MKKIFGYLAVLAFAAGVTACTEDVDYTPAQPVDPDCMEIYFAADNEGMFAFDEAADVSTLVIPVKVCRTLALEAVTMPLTVEQEGEMFNAPAEISFAEGEAETTFNVTLNSKELGVHSLKFSLGEDPTLINPYLEKGVPVHSIQIEFYRWVKVCDCSFTSSALGFTTNPVLEQKEGTSTYRLLGLYTPTHVLNFILGSDGKSYTIAEEDIVVSVSGYPGFFTGLGIGCQPLYAAFDGSVEYSYFIEGVGMQLSVYYLTPAQQFGWYDEIIYFN